MMDLLYMALIRRTALAAATSTKVSLDLITHTEADVRNPVATNCCIFIIIETHLNSCAFDREHGANLAVGAHARRLAKPVDPRSWKHGVEEAGKPGREPRRPA